MPAVSERVTRFDAAIDAAFDSLRGHPGVDRLMYAASELGDFSLIWHLLSTSLALFGDERAECEALRLSAALGVESLLVNGLIKSLVRRERPDSGDLQRPHHLRTPRTSSFPSGHASAAACSIALVAERGRPLRTVTFLSVGTVVALSRIHVRIHHGSDVVGGLIIGAVIGTVIRRRWPLR